MSTRQASSASKRYRPEEQSKVKRDRGIRYLPYVALGLVLAALLQLVPNVACRQAEPSGQQPLSSLQD